MDDEEFRLSVESIEETGHTVLHRLDKRADDTVKKLYKRMDRLFSAFTRRIDDIEELKLAHDYAKKHMTELRRHERMGKRLEVIDEQNKGAFGILNEQHIWTFQMLIVLGDRIDDIEDGIDVMNQKLDTLLNKKGNLIRLNLVIEKLDKLLKKED